MNQEAPRAQWQSFNSYILVTIGAIVGLGNIFEFPFLVTKYGGIFIIFYILCQAAIALPLLLGELLIGRRGSQNPVGSFRLLAYEANANLKWGFAGWFCVFIAFFTACYYVASAAFPIGYLFASLKELMQSTNIINAPLNLNSNIMTSFFELESCFLIFVFLAGFVVYRGINRGLETISRIAVPLYIIILFCLVSYISTHGYFIESIKHLFYAKYDASLHLIFVMALGLAFLKYNVGMGTMIVYGSYLPLNVSFGKSTLIIISVDFLVSLLAYFVIYPLLLAAHPDGNIVELSHHNVHHIFGSIPCGIIIATIFFFAAVIASWTHIIAMFETITITLVERLSISRYKACFFMIVAVIVFGTIQVCTHVQDFNFLIINKYPLEYLIKNIVMHVLTPVSALLIALFVGFIMHKDATKNELHFDDAIYNKWYFLVRYIVPGFIVIVLLSMTVLDKMPYQ